MLTHLAPASTGSLIVLVFCFVLVLAFEFSNGFHDTANAVATVIYTHTLDAVPAVILSGIMNFAGVLLGGVAVAYTMVELLPPEVLTPPNGNPATSRFAISVPGRPDLECRDLAAGHSVLQFACADRRPGWRRHRELDRRPARFRPGCRLGPSLGRSAGRCCSLPILGFLLAGALFRIMRLVIHDKKMFEPPEDGKRPELWVRALLVLTCSGVSFTHGSNDGQKSIGLIMLTVIGLLPVQFALNMEQGSLNTHELAATVQSASALIQRYGDDEKDKAQQSVRQLADKFRAVDKVADIPRGRPHSRAPRHLPDRRRA